LSPSSSSLSGKLASVSEEHSGEINVQMWVDKLVVMENYKQVENNYKNSYHIYQKQTK